LTPSASIKPQVCSQIPIMSWALYWGGWNSRENIKDNHLPARWSIEDLEGSGQRGCCRRGRMPQSTLRLGVVQASSSDHGRMPHRYLPTRHELDPSCDFYSFEAGIGLPIHLRLCLLGPLACSADLPHLSRDLTSSQVALA
jgi:hypothetical protein